jgi:hypothetical protein
MTTKKDPLTMPLSMPTLAAIQTAGSAVFAAEAELKLAVQRQAEQVHAAMRDTPFDAGNDSLFEDWKTAARLAQALTRIEAELRQVYDLAAGMNGPRLAAPASRPALGAPGGRVEVLETLNATDVRIKKSPRDTTPALRGNPAKVLARLKQVLPPQGAVKVNRSNLARDSGLPKGSINAALAQLQRRGYIAQGRAGELRLV